MDLVDLRKYLVSDVGKPELKGIGGLSTPTAGVLLRKLVELLQQDAERFFGGTDKYDGGNVGGWYAGSWLPGWVDPAVHNWSDGPPALKPLMDTGNVRFSYQSVSIHTYLIDQSWKKKLDAAKKLADDPAVALQSLKQRLLTLAEDRSEQGGGVAVWRYWKAGAIDYKKVPELAGVDLERYRGAEGEETRVTVQK